MRRIIIVLVLIGAGVTAFFVFHHPPMQLMPPPLLFQEGGEAIVDAAPALVEDTRLELLYATNRLPVGPEDDRTYTVAPDRRLHFGRATLRIGADGSPAPVSEADCGGVWPRHHCIDAGRLVVALERSSALAGLDLHGDGSLGQPSQLLPIGSPSCVLQQR